MIKHEFLRRLEQNLMQLPVEERKKQVSFYAEMIDDRMEDGMTEEAAVEALGDPAKAAQQILENMPLGTLVKTRVKPSGGWTVTAVVLAVIGCPIWIPIALVVLIIAVTVFAVLWVCAAAVFAVVLTLLATSVLVLISPFFTIGSAGLPIALLMVGSGLAGIGLTVFVCIGAIYLIKGIAKLSVLLGRLVKSAFIRKERR